MHMIGLSQDLAAKEITPEDTPPDISNPNGSSPHLIIISLNQARNGNIVVSARQGGSESDQSSLVSSI